LVAAAELLGGAEVVVAAVVDAVEGADQNEEPFVGVLVGGLVEGAGGVFMEAAASRPLYMARCTPVDSRGSRKQAASPARNQPGPLKASLT
jgi:hypothetical protein